MASPDRRPRRCSTTSPAGCCSARTSRCHRILGRGWSCRPDGQPRYGVSVSVTLRQLAEIIGADPAFASAAVEVTGVTVRAQDALPGDLFAALQGTNVHG